MAAAAIAKHLQFDYLSNSDPFRALQGFEVLEQAFLEAETQMEFGGTPNLNTVVEVSWREHRYIDDDHWLIPPFESLTTYLHRKVS